jgi:hypothetical protein
VSDDHISFDELAELDEGLLSPERAAEVQQHLSGCAECRERLEAIGSTKQTLGSLPPEPMPAAVKARLDRALADASSASAGEVVPDLSAHRERRRWGRPTLAGSVAAAVILAAFVAIIVGHLGNATSSGGGASTDAGALGSAGLPAVTQPKNYTRTSSGLTYTPNNLLTYIPGLVAGAEFGPDTQSAASPQSSSVPAPAASRSGGSDNRVLDKQNVPAALRPLFESRARILHCAAVLTGNPHAVPIAVDFGYWTNGQYTKAPSAIFVMTDPNPKKVDVWVTDPTCSGTAASQVRTYNQVPVN